MRAKIRDYNIIPWGDYFYLDETSPSGLRWKVDRMGGRDYKTIVVYVGDIAGNLQTRTIGNLACWRVTLNNIRYLAHRIIHILLHGSIDIDLVIDHLDGDASNNKHSNLALKSSRANMQNCKMASNNTSGITGVYIGFTQKGSNIYKRWIASWRDVNHKRHAKAFSIIKYGYDEAFMLAVAYRNEQIKLLNESGQCYTERHLQTKG